MPDIGSLKEELATILDREQPTCLWFSGGSDSRLLLELLIEDGRDFGLLRFDDGWTREQSKAVDEVIIAKNLPVFSYPAIEHVLASEAGEISMVSLYVVDGGGNSAMLVRDVVDNPDRCAFDVKLETAKGLRAPVEWKQHIWGTRSEDRHWLGTDEPLAAREWTIGSKAFSAPLWEWTAEDVRAALETLGIETTGPDTGDIGCCVNCLKEATGRVFCPKAGEEIDAVTWDGAGNTELIRTAHREMQVLSGQFA